MSSFEDEFDISVNLFYSVLFFINQVITCKHSLSPESSSSFYSKLLVFGRNIFFICLFFNITHYKSMQIIEAIVNPND